MSGITSKKRTMNPANTMNAATLNEDDSLSFGKVTIPTLPGGRLIGDLKPEQSTSVNGNSPAAGEPKKNNRRRHIFAGVAVLAVSVATAVYYLEYVAPYESTDDAF